MRAAWLPKLVVAPGFALARLFIYGLIAWNGYLSLSASRLLPNYEFAGFEQYVNLFESERFHVALTNMAIFGTLFVAGAMAIGRLLARAPGRLAKRSGNAVHLTWRPEDMHLFDAPHTSEGSAPRPGRLIIFKFPSEDQARCWIGDPEYQNLSEHRRAGTHLEFLTMVRGMTPHN